MRLTDTAKQHSNNTWEIVFFILIRDMIVLFMPSIDDNTC